MSKYDYDAAKKLQSADTGFYPLLMAAMLRADPYNRVLLRSVFPLVWEEVQQRDHAPGGKLPGDDQPARVVVRAASPGEQLHPTCPECENPWADPPCGLPHSIIASENSLHR